MKPDLNRNISLVDFQEYYWLKSELIQFCRENKLPVSGGKNDIQKRIEHFITTGEILSQVKNKSNKVNIDTSIITLETRLIHSYKNNSTNREFFKSVIGDRFKFNVIFMKWVKQNPQKTYQDAVNRWLKIEEDKKSGKKFEIGSQFEYNQYTRDFFEANPGKTRNDVIRCWKYKKELPGSNKYQDSDLSILVGRKR